MKMINTSGLGDFDFSREEMIEEEVTRCREGKKFEEKYLRKGFIRFLLLEFFTQDVKTLSSVRHTWARWMLVM